MRLPMWKESVATVATTSPVARRAVVRSPVRVTWRPTSVEQVKVARIQFATSPMCRIAAAPAVSAPRPRIRPP